LPQVPAADQADRADVRRPGHDLDRRDVPGDELIGQLDDLNPRLLVQAKPLVEEPSDRGNFE
jgi:hypothetical protein